MVGRCDLPTYRCARPNFSSSSKIFQLFQILPIFQNLEAAHGWVAHRTVRKVAFFYNVEFYDLLYNKNRIRAGRNLRQCPAFPVYTKSWKRRRVGPSLYGLEKFSSCWFILLIFQLPSLLGHCRSCYAFQLFQLLYVSAAGTDGGRRAVARAGW